MTKKTSKIAVFYTFSTPLF